MADIVPLSPEQLYRLHRERQERRRDENEALGKRVAELSGVVSNQMVDSVNTGIASVFTNQKLLEAQAKQLEENTKKMTKQAQQWVKLLEEFNTSLKELGDVENWAKKMEHDMRDISTALAFVHASGAAKGR